MTVKAVSPSRETLDFIKEAGGEAFKLCYQCGLCSGVCPWNQVRNFIVRLMMHQAQLGLVNFEDEAWWLCATCRACVGRCPRGVEIIDVMRAMRRILVGFGVGYVPDSLKLTLKNISAVGNPVGEAPEKRADWAKDLDIKEFSPDKEFLYFPCCIPAYDPKVKRVARSLSTILKKAKIDFGILGSAENCCGESIRKAGNEDLFENLGRSNTVTFRGKGVKKVLVSSPHCYHTFKNEYPKFGINFEPLHYTQYLAQLLEEGRLKFGKEVKKKVTYHDPCYLGRHNNIYDAPRQLLKSIPGLELLEMPDNREDSLCCGGGGGRIWQETKKGERFSDIRLEQAIEVGAEILATACPYCILNFDDSVLSMDKADVIEIKDVSELILEALE